MFPSATGSRSYEVFCDMDEDAFELFKSTHRSRTRGFSSPVRKAIVRPSEFCTSLESTITLMSESPDTSVKICTRPLVISAWFLPLFCTFLSSAVSLCLSSASHVYACLIACHLLFSSCSVPLLPAIFHTCFLHRCHHINVPYKLAFKCFVV